MLCCSLKNNYRENMGERGEGGGGVSHGDFERRGGATGFQMAVRVRDVLCR